MKIYTGRGDAGQTDLHDQTRVSKANPRIESYGTVDELNALIGSIHPTGHGDIDGALREIQNHLHIVQAQLADPTDANEGPAIRSDHVDNLETWIDEIDAELEPLTAFILPGGGRAGSDLHVARTVCRRAERRLVAFAEESETTPDAILTYLNRLSDALFVFARACNSREGIDERNPTY